MLPADSSSFSKTIKGLNKDDNSKRPLPINESGNPHKKERCLKRKRARVAHEEEKQQDDIREQQLRPVVEVIQKAKPEERAVFVAAFKAILRNRNDARRKHASANRQQNEPNVAPAAPAAATHVVAMDVEVTQVVKQTK